MARRRALQKVYGVTHEDTTRLDGYCPNKRLAATCVLKIKETRQTMVDKVVVHHGRLNFQEADAKKHIGTNSGTSGGRTVTYLARLKQ